MLKIGTLNLKNYGVIAIYYDNKNPGYRPYKVCHEWKEPGEHGLRSRRKQINSYSDLYSCTVVMENIAKHHNEEGR